MKKHFIFIVAFASVALLAMSGAIGLIDHGRSFQFVLVWMLILILAPLYVISSWISMKVEKEGYIGTNRSSKSKD